jgi:hypothetical protein
MFNTRTLLCAWVLWAHWAVGGQYQPMRAYTTQVDCEAAEKSWTRPRDYNSTVCLPDTVKPGK